MSNLLSGQKSFNIRDFGAVGDGTAIDTPAFKKAIDACHLAGGGKVYCPPGRYLIGSIQLKSNVFLHLEAGARILAATDRKLYEPVNLNDILPNPYNYGLEHLIWARDAENVGIEGRGTIDGQGQLFFGPLRKEINFYTIREWRPWQLIAFIECQNVILRDITIVDAPGWTIWPVGCERVEISGITILNDPKGPNTDGIDPDCCSSVRISNCHIETGDDCIALKCDPKKLSKFRPCEDVVVTHCVLRSTCNAIRLGYEGDGIIRNCTFSNLIMTNTRTGINILVPTEPEAGFIHGPRIENISFSNITMDVVRPFFVWIGDEDVIQGSIRDVYFSNINGKAKRASYFGGSKRIPLKNIQIDNLNLEISGEMDDEFAKEIPYPYRIWDYFTKKGIPHILFFRDVQNVGLRNCRIYWGEIKGPWQSVIKLDSINNGSLQNLSIAGSPNTASPALHLHQVQNFTIQGCRTHAETALFLKMSGSGEKISLLQNDLGNAEEAFELGSELATDSFFEQGNILKRRAIS